MLKQSVQWCGGVLQLVAAAFSLPSKTGFYIRKKEKRLLYVYQNDTKVISEI